MDGQLALAQRVCDAVGKADVKALLTLGPAIEGAKVRAPAGVAVTAWREHDELLPTCAAVIGHGGLGTTLRSLAHGVPLVLLPLGRDQAVNAARVEGLGAGIALAPDSAPAAIRSALGRVLEELGFATAARAAAARIAAGEPDRRAVEALEACFAIRPARRRTP
jgi:UDP:flavonoid glycosyltransferase YjiC (YdhE family)